ncbi:hypothetical protein TNCV_4672551 [Trichonephila clavipes]|nr:hypothetical protein TNCV_4672551 [Trichonephila clavipes]
MDTQDWTQVVKARPCKTAVDCLPVNSSSRHSSKLTRKLRNRCPPSHRALNAKPAPSPPTALHLKESFKRVWKIIRTAN